VGAVRAPSALVVGAVRAPDAWVESEGLSMATMESARVNSARNESKGKKEVF
jgi:hypothetical protein